MQRIQIISFVLFSILAVSYSQSASNCGENTVPIGSCGTACPATCAVPVPELCIDLCITDGCVCADGYIRSVNANSPCILRSDCPSTTTRPGSSIRG